MQDTEIFGTHMVLMLTLIGVTYLLFALAPVIWPAIRAFRKSQGLRRPWLFVSIVACLVYGAFSLFIIVLFVPAEMYAIFIAPQLEAAGRQYGRTFLYAMHFIEDYWWLVLPVFQLLATVICTRKLASKWEAICVGLDG